MSKRFDTGMASTGDLSSLAIPEPIDGKDIFSCPLRIQKVCNGPGCLPEWNRDKDDPSLHVFIYDKRTGVHGEKPVNRYHIVKKALHHEGYCKLYMKRVWALISEEDVDLWYDEGGEEPDFKYILKPQESEG